MRCEPFTCSRRWFARAWPSSPPFGSVERCSSSTAPDGFSTRFVSRWWSRFRRRDEMNVLNVVLPLGSSVLSFVFAAMVLDQWWQRRHSFQLVWGIGLLWYGISAGTEFLGGAFGWSEPLYRTWYLFGAFFVAAYLGAGSIYLLSKSRFGYFAGVTVIIGGLLSLLFSHADAQGTHTPLYPGSGTAGTVAFVVA